MRGLVGWSCAVLSLASLAAVSSAECEDLGFGCAISSLDTLLSSSGENTLEDSAEKVASSSLLQSRTKLTAVQKRRLSRAREPRLNGQVCFFVNTDTAPEDSDGRARAAAVADTWAAKPAAGSKVYYFVDEAMPPYHLPESVRPDQIIKTIRVDYTDLPERTRSMLVRINSKPFVDTCAWFALVDDDTYVNTANIVAKTSVLDASQLHYMGVVYVYRGFGNTHDETGNFVHGDYKMFSAAAVPKISEVAARCRMWEPGYEDVDIARCIAQLGFSSSLPPESFGDFVHDNRRNAGHPTTLQQALDRSEETNSPLACLDILHKMIPEDMRAFHSQVQGGPSCTRQPMALVSLRG